MSSVAEIKTSLQTSLAQNQALDDKLTAIGTLVQDLKQQLAAGGVATQADLDAIMAEVQAAQAPIVEAETKAEAITGGA